MAAVDIEPRVLRQDVVVGLRGARRPTALIGPTRSGKTSLVNRLLESDPDFIGVQVARTADRVERTILELGASVGSDAEHEVAERLRQSFDDPTPALDFLDRVLRGRRLVVDDYDALRPSALPSELSELFWPSHSQVSTWVGKRAAVLTSATSLPDYWTVQQIPLDRKMDPPWGVVGEPQQSDALWNASRHDTERYRVALTHWRLTGSAPSAELLEIESWLSESVWEAAPESARFIMALLHAYGSVFPAPLFEQLVQSIDCGEWALDYAERALLVERSSHWYWLSPLWQESCLRLIDNRLEQDAHRKLANFFAKISSSAQSPNPRWIQAAYRHYINAGMSDEAARYLPFGVGLLLDAGRSASLVKTHALAVEYYRSAMNVDEAIRRETGQGVGARIRGYARHYYHYNRHEAQQEPIEQTEAGYQQSVVEYPENALFWSRLILARFYRDDWDAALDTYTRANKAVQPQPAREKYLLGRTVTKLLERRPRPLINAAVVVWRDTTVVSEPRAEEAFARLRQSCAVGWDADTLRVPNLSETVFERPIRVEISQRAGDFRCSLVDVGVAFTAPSMLAALRGAVEQLRCEVAESLRGHADQFTDEQRKRKRLLLGLVDVVNSEIKGPGPKFRWLFGKVIEHAELGRVVETSSGEHYDLDPSIAVPDSPDGMYEVKIRTGRGGVLAGPVVELQPLFDNQAELEAAKEDLDLLLGIDSHE